MTRRRSFEAVISDMDGVLTRTSRLHERAWRQMFDELLARSEGQRPFSSADYRAYVDGKPRYQGAADFLASRHLALPFGDPTDGPDAPTICGLANRKNALYLELLGDDTVEVFEDAVAALARWARGELRLGVVSSSRNCRRVLRAARLEDRFAAIVDGRIAEELHLEGKPEIMLEAARRLGVPPVDTVILEDATAGVRAGRRDGFGLVVGIARTGNEQDLRDAGADAVATRVDRVRFLRRLPSALDRTPELAARRGARPLAVFLDYDGTLAPIVADPRDAWMSGETRAALAALARRCPVTVVSGRDRPDIEARVGIEGLLYAGNHGFDIAGGGHRRMVAEVDEALGEVDRAARELARRLGHLSGVLIERKRYSVAVHYRQVDSAAAIAQIERTVDAIRDTTCLRKRIGKQVLELEPAVDWDKGRAVRWVRDVLPLQRPEDAFLVYIGDDETDEDAFAALAGDGASIRVGPAETTSLADYRLADPGEVCDLLRMLARA